MLKKKKKIKIVLKIAEKYISQPCSQGFTLLNLQVRGSCHPGVINEIANKKQSIAIDDNQ